MVADGQCQIGREYSDLKEIVAGKETNKPA